MSRTLFEQAAPQPVRRWRRLTVVTSIVLHAGVVAALVALQFSDVGAPLMSRRVQAFMLPSAPPLPPPVPRATPPPSATTPDVKPDAAPITATENPTDSPPVVASTDVPSMPGLVGDPHGVRDGRGVVSDPVAVNAGRLAENLDPVAVAGPNGNVHGRRCGLAGNG